ncbi:hypothetical protein [Saccharopolyspora cebuensis]|uniref:hypothetical protein n=1 Tax=Saccharopolyspora cebuensis TaxID=418759 RepID=UPI0031E5855B
MSAHLIPDPAVTPCSDPLAPGWLALSAAMTEEAPFVADRDDLVVTIAPGAGHGSPACFLPPHAAIEVDGAHFGALDPGTADPADPADRARYAAVWGLFTHECAHARHTRWSPPPEAPAGAVAAALLLEESRIEAAQLRRRPDDRHWLRASARKLILADLPTDPGMTARGAADTAGLLLARHDAGILEDTEVRHLRTTITGILGADTLATLRGIWRQAHTVADDDAAAMIELGRRWCAAAGLDPDETPSDTREPGPSDSTSPAGTATLAEAVRATVDNIDRHAATEPAPGSDTRPRRPADPAADDARRAAETVFDKSGSSRTGTAVLTAPRTPTPDERRAARRLARALTTAGVTDRHTTRTTSPVPPGRLRMRGALAADAQRAAGQIPTAEPFTRTHRRLAPAPPLRVGIACDVSGSMRRVAPATASAAWIMAHATRHTLTPADSATVIFGSHVQPITHPGTAPANVTEFGCRGSVEDLPRAINALDGALGLAQPGAARLLVILSDGKFHPWATTGGQTLLDRLRATGCGVLWLTTDDRDRPLHGATVHQLADPADTATVIGRAATTALRTATH